MFTSTSDHDFSEAGTVDVLIPLIRAAATIGFAIAPCSLGFVIIAVSEQLIRSIMVGDDPERLVSELQNQFPNEALQVDENYDAGMVAKVVDLIERPNQAMDLPLDTRGGDFQERVWEALQKVPAGSTSNYTFLAEHIGVPNAVRATPLIQRPGYRRGQCDLALCIGCGFDRGVFDFTPPGIDSLCVRRLHRLTE